MNKKTIKLKYVDFWGTFENEEKTFFKILSKKYNLILSDEPDFLIYSCFGKDHQKYDCVKIFFTGENIKPNFWECDYSFSFDYDNYPKNYRSPLWSHYHDYRLLQNRPDPIQILKEKRKFCNFVYSNPNCKKRNEFFKKLNKYKKVDAGGKLFNNIGSNVIDKNGFLQQYKFTISFENESAEGYTTEKIFQPMLQNSIPIYWGNPLINKEFNTKSFLNWHDYNSDEALIEKIIEIDQDDKKYLQILKQPYFNNNIPYKNVLEENILSQFDYIFNRENYIPISKTWKKNYKYWRKSCEYYKNYSDRFLNKLKSFKK